MMEHAVDQKLSLDDFAAEVDGDVAPGARKKKGPRRRRIPLRTICAC
jgi:hypothetical protein